MINNIQKKYNNLSVQQIELYLFSVFVSMYKNKNVKTESNE